MLQRADVRPPYLLVGHSWGGLISRIFAHKYPEDVAGMVLIDTNPPTCTAPLADDVLAKLDTHAEEESNPGVHLPADVRAARNWARSLSPPEEYMSLETSDLLEPEREIAATTVGNKVPLGDKPLYVISAGRLSWDAQARASGRSYLTALRAHITNEACTAGLSRNSQFAVAYASFHAVHLYEPQIVTNAIRRVLKSVRTGAPLEPLE